MGFADLVKNGWHPEKAAAAGASSSSSSSGRSSSMVPKSFGLGKFVGSATSSSNYEASARVPSKPVSELPDAKLFPPPPKHREFHPDAGSAAIAPEYAYLYQPALERKRQEEQRPQQQQQWGQPMQLGQTPQYQPQGQSQYQQPGNVPGQPVYQPPAAAQPAQSTYQQPVYQQSQQTYQSPPQQAYQSPSYPPPQQTYQPPAHLPPSAQSPPLPQRGPMPSLPPRNGSTPPFQQPAYQPPPQQQQPAYQRPQQQQQQQPTYQPPQQHRPTYQPTQQAQAYQSPQQPPAPAYQQPTVTPSYQSQPQTPSYQQPAQPFVRGHGYSQSLADGHSPSVSPPPISQPTPRYPNFASEISRARVGFSSTSPAPPGQRVPSGHRHTQSTSVVGKKAPPPPPKPKNPALRGSPTSPVVGQSSLPGAFPENGHVESNMNNNTKKTPSGPPTPSSRPSLNDSANVPAKPSGLISRPILTPKPPPAATPATVHQQPAQTQWAPPQVDLELDKKWFAMGNNPMKLLQLPAFLSGRTYASSIAMAGNTKTIMLSVRFPDLSRTKFRIEVDRYDDNNVSAQRVDFAPPGRPSASDLDAAATSFGENVAKFVEANVGRQIGDGECWTVAKESLKASGAMESCGFIHGVEIWTSNSTTGVRSGDEAMLRRGDILQFKSARFRSSGQAGRIVEEKYVGAPDHTAVIVAVHSVAPVVVTVLEQNVGGVRSVQQGSYVFGEMMDGSVVAYRPFWKEWAGELETSWP
ncbi:hypothetical protein V1527DRAFT_11463 [Lipomyces starkeyi]